MFDEPGFSGDADAEPDAILLETFVYCSRAAADIDADDVNRLVAFSQKRNVARGITGVLVFGNGVFFQWVEGPPAEVKSLIASLHGDPRHHDIVTLDQCVDMRERLYPHWEMEQVAADDLREVLEEAAETTEDEASLAALQRILAHLADGPLLSMGRS